MRIVSGTIKANEQDIEDIKTFLFHAKADMVFGWDGSYGGYDENDKKAEREATKELESGKRGLENIEFLLEGLCDKWK
jgi:hypothetical protein